MAAKTAKPEWYDDKVKIKLPKLPKGEDNFVIASVNGYVVKIKRGEEVEIPRAIAEVIQHSEEAREKADEYQDSIER